MNRPLRLGAIQDLSSSCRGEETATSVWYPTLLPPPSYTPPPRLVSVEKPRQEGGWQEVLRPPAGALGEGLYEVQLTVPSRDSGDPGVARVCFPLLGVVSFSYQRPLDTLAFGAGSAGCAAAGLGRWVSTNDSTMWAFSFVQLASAAPANSQARQRSLQERLWHKRPCESYLSAAGASAPQLSSGRCRRRASLGGSRYYLTDGVAQLKSPREKPE